MLTVLDTISMAGDRTKQNDDMVGAAGDIAWVIDGATDLQDDPMTGWASDASWMAHRANAAFEQAAVNAPADETGLRSLIRAAAGAIRTDFFRFPRAETADLADWPVSSCLLAARTADGLIGLDLGDCRVFGLDADGRAFAMGGPPAAADNERAAAAAAMQASAGNDGRALYREAPVLARLRQERALRNNDPRSKLLTLHQECADVARFWSVPLKRPAHVLLATDGFAFLADRYDAYTPETLMRAVLDKGLAALLVELRAIENDDAGGAKHPRFKRSDDSTAILLRLS